MIKLDSQPMRLLMLPFVDENGRLRFKSELVRADEWERISAEVYETFSRELAAAKRD